MADNNHLGMNFSVSANVQPLLYKIEDACKQINAAGNQLKGFSVGVEDSTQKMVKTAKKANEALERQRAQTKATIEEYVKLGKLLRDGKGIVRYTNGVAIGNSTLPTIDKKIAEIEQATKQVEEMRRMYDAIVSASDKVDQRLVGMTQELTNASKEATAQLEEQRRSYDMLDKAGKRVDQRLAEMTQELTKNMDQTEGVRNKYGLLLDSEQRVVEGLAKWRVAAGQYINAQGEIVDEYGRSLKGLTVLQQKLKMYRDELGNVVDASGNLVKGLGVLDQKLSDVDKALGLEYDELGRLVKKVQVDGKEVVRFYDELTDAQKKAGLFADEHGRIFQDLGNKGVKNLRKYTASAEEALKSQREFQVSLMEAQSILAQVGENSGDAIIKGFAIYQKIFATFGDQLLKRGGANATITTIFRGFKDNLSEMKTEWGEFWKEFVDGIKKTEAPLNDWVDKIAYGLIKLKGGFKNANDVGSSLGQAAKNFFGPFLNIGVTLLPEVVALFGKISEYIQEINDRPYKGLSDELKEIRKQAEATGHAIKGMVNAAEDVAVAAHGLRKSSFATELVRLKAEVDRTEGAYHMHRKWIEDAERQYVGPYGSGQIGSSTAKENLLSPYREAYNKAYNAYSTEVRRQVDSMISELKLESERLTDELNDLKLKKEVVDKEIEKFPDDEEARKEQAGLQRLITDKQTAIKVALEKEAAGSDTSAYYAQKRAEKMREIGIDGFLKAQEDATVSYQNLGATLKKWARAVDDKDLTLEEARQAYKRARDAVRQSLESELGVKWGEESSGIATQLAKLKTAVENKAITEKEQASALSQLYAKERDALAQSLGLELDARDKLAETYEEAAGRAREAFQNGLISAEDEDKLLAAAKRRQLDALRALADETGVTLDAQGVPTAQAEKKKVELEAAREYLAAVEKWKAKLADSEIANDAYEAAIEQLKARALAQAQEGWNGKDAEKQLAELQELRDAEIITAKKFNDAKEELAAQVEAAAKKQRLDNLRSELGVDSIMESLKTPAARLKETMDKLAEAQKAGVISEKELAAVRSKAYQEYLDATQERGVEETLTKIKPESKSKDKSEKTTAGESLSQGSESLYKAMLKRRAPTAYESKMQSAADRMCEFEALNYRNGLEQTDRLDVIANGFQALGNIRVFG